MERNHSSPELTTQDLRKVRLFTTLIVQRRDVSINFSLMPKRWLILNLEGKKKHQNFGLFLKDEQIPLPVQEQPGGQ